LKHVPYGASMTAVAVVAVVAKLHLWE
jgi:hypothetical protein